ncbi:MAG: hypothetical protein ABF991_00555 [Liquorilactobacillus hordei]|uniref:hypothetical protein n=1 Tax=Liquorilactobacillus hordei TaxID=468911 RepID=UPI0039E92FFC
MNSNERSTAMNEYAKILWDRKYGSRKECGVNGKWYHYLLNITVNMVTLSIFVILFVSFVGWLILACINVDHLILPLSDYFYSKNVYLTKNDAIRRRVSSLMKKHPNIDFTINHKYLVPLDFPDSQWMTVAKKESSYYWLSNDLSFTEEQITNLKKWISEKGIQGVIGNKNRIECNRITHNPTLDNGLYVRVVDIDDAFFQTEYGKKLAEKYKVYSDEEFWSYEDKPKNDFSRLNVNKLVNYGKKDCSFQINWSGNNA